jgi:acetyltransferase-like isoleucine patch superfamily enzyme
VGFGLALYDALYFTLAALLYGGAGLLGLRAAEAFSRHLPALVAWPVAILCALLALIAEVALLTALCPRLVPGRYRMMQGRVFWGWLFRSLLRRVLLLPSIKWVLYTSNILRWLSLRAMGARVAFASNISSDVDILDPALTTIGAGAVLGMRTALAGHYVENGKLILGEVRVGAGALLAAEVRVGPGVTIGDRAFIKPLTSLGVRVQVGEGADVGPWAIIDAQSVIGARARVGPNAYVPARTVVPDDGEVEALSSASSTTSKAAPAV